MKITNGITLIALVITIIVLLILAGIVLVTLTGQGNTIGNAENAVEKYKNSVVGEQILLNRIEEYFESYTNEVGESDNIVDKTEITNNPQDYFGAYVTNYTTPSGDPEVGWRIFYADENNIYLIADDYIHYNYAPKSENYTLTKNSEYRLSFNEIYQDYEGSTNITDSRIIKWLGYINKHNSSEEINIRSMAFMLDLTKWSEKYANLEYADYAIGGPTIIKL